MTPRNQSDFLFVTYTDRPDKVSKGSLRAVRKHVMDDYFRRHKGKDTRRHSHSCPHSTAECLVRLRNDSGASSVDSASQSSSDEGPIVEPSIPALPQASTPLDINAPIHRSLQLHRPQPPQFPYPLSRSLGETRTDPFDVLPVVGTIDQNELLYWHSYPPERGHWEAEIPWLSTYDSIWTKNLWDVSKDHKGMFHVLLCIGQARRSMVVGHHDNSTLIYHLIQAMRYIRERTSAQDVDDSLLMLICNLARICLADDDTQPAIIHMKAVQQLLMSSSFHLGNLQWRVITWTDLRLASTLLQAPFLPYCDVREDPKSTFPPHLLEIAQASTARSMEMMPESMPEQTSSWFLGLWISSLAYRSQAIVNQQQQFWGMQDVPYQTVHEICILISKDGKRRFEARQALVLIMRVYAWTCVPEYSPEYACVKVCYGPLMKRVSEAALNRLHSELSKPENLISWWKSQDASLECLLWTLFVAWGVARIECNSHRHEAMPQHASTGWLQRQLVEVVRELGIVSEEGLETSLKMFPWVDHFSKECCADLWRLVCSNGVHEIVEEEPLFDEFLNDDLFMDGFEEGGGNLGDAMQ